MSYAKAIVHDAVPAFRSGIARWLEPLAEVVLEIADIRQLSEVKYGEDVLLVASVRGNGDVEDLAANRGHDRPVPLNCLAIIHDGRSWQCPPPPTLAADAAISSDATGDALLSAVHLMQAGHAVLPRWLLRDFGSRRQRVLPPDHLSEHELQLLALLRGGHTANEIGARIGYSEREVFRQLYRLYRAIGARNRSDAIAIASRWDA